MNKQTWLQDYANLVGKLNKISVRVEAIRDAQNRHWGRYAVINADTGITVTTFDYKKAKGALQ